MLLVSLNLVYLLYFIGQQIAFFAYMSKNVAIKTLSKYKTFVYDRVETNTGNGYDIKSGKFTAPESGHYVFHTSTTAYDKSYSIIEIVKNNKLVDVALADANDHNDRAAASTMTILSLAKGDTVLVRAGAYYSGHYLETDSNWPRKRDAAFLLIYILCCTCSSYLKI